MAVNKDVMELISILNEEGFGWLGGRLLSEISLGRPPDRLLEAEQASTEALLDVSVVEDYDRKPIPDAEQLSEAVKFLRLALVEPARRLADAETIGGRLSEGAPLRIEFVDSEGEANPALSNSADPGDASVASKLDMLLTKLGSE